LAQDPSGRRPLGTASWRPGSLVALAPIGAPKSTRYDAAKLWQPENEPASSDNSLIDLQDANNAESEAQMAPWVTRSNLLNQSKVYAISLAISTKPLLRLHGDLPNVSWPLRLIYNIPGTLLRRL